jgi:hypothetical protein
MVDMKDLSSPDHDKPSTYAQRATADKSGLSSLTFSTRQRTTRQRNTRPQQTCQIRQRQQQ